MPRRRTPAANPGGQWVKIREFDVFAPTTGYDTTLAAAPGSSAALAFDADPTTAYVAASSPIAGSALTRHLGPGERPRTVQVIGAVAATVQVLRGDTWHTIGTARAGREYQSFTVNGRGDVTSVRLLFTRGSTAPRVAEFVVGTPAGSR